MLCCSRGGVLRNRCCSVTSSSSVGSICCRICFSAVRLRLWSLVACSFVQLSRCMTCIRAAHCVSLVACCRSRVACLSVGVVVRMSSSCSFVSLYLCCGVVLMNFVRPCPAYFRCFCLVGVGEGHECLLEGVAPYVPASACVALLDVVL